MRAVCVHPDATGVKMIVDIPAWMGAPVNHQNFAPGIHQGPRDDCSGQAGTNDEILHTFKQLARRGLMKWAAPSRQK